MATYTQACLHRLAILVACLLLMPFAQAATLVLNNVDDAGEGFNDTTVVAPVGGNPGTTVGEQRTAVFEFAAALVGGFVNSSEDIIVRASFDPLSCSASSGTLGQAGPDSFHIDFPGRPHPQTFYAQAQANSILGYDIELSLDDMHIELNSSVDNNSNCLNNRNWYYGLDGNPPGNDFDLLTTILHEIVHGLGFVTLVNIGTGGKPSGNGCPIGGCDDGYMRQIEDHSLASNWPVMSDAQRAASATDDPDLHITGTNISANLGGLSAGTNSGHARLHGPNELTGGSVAHFSTALHPYELMEPQQTGTADKLGLAGFVLQDMGWSVVASAAPIISTPGSQLMLDTATLQLDVALMDNDSNAGSLDFSATSSNPTVIDDNGLVEGGSGRVRTLAISPNNGTTGTATITLSVNDGSSSNGTQFQVEVTDNLPPEVSITDPLDGAIFYGLSQEFSASADDFEQGDISASLAWNSSINGAIGNGANIMPTLSDGSHLITASVVDNASNPGSDAITVVVDAAGDADGDGLANAQEIALGTDPEDSDSDNDFASDFIEVNRDDNPANYTVGVDTDPNNPDTDGDGVRDGADFAPLDPEAGGEQVPSLPLWGMLALAALLLARAWHRLPLRGSAHR
ncbi:MAG: hypothetical protein KJP25_07730 [Gammaproteobacteria bacterium]|nr:hypothetical protein [Gammaproteobacteria bacterium]MBT8149846.1 hypothetical protein [Gammaproteobacteria bacterium]NNM12546.1 hypothetical protein [Pseudomonadales bacterium]RZV58506.1 MAG: hypothetical protein EX270_02700 [Pseudomonadales bacterium]